MAEHSPATAGSQPHVRPPWLDEVVPRLGDGELFPAAARGRSGRGREVARRSAVLMLFGPCPLGGEDVVLTKRSDAMRSHAGQVSFPGGALDPGDASAGAAALREGQEEVGLEPGGVEIVAELSPLFLPPSGYLVTPVLAWWARPAPLVAVDPAEVAIVARVPVAELIDPANRFVVRHPSGYTGPGFEVSGLFVWGFTAGLLAALLDVAGLSREWDRRVRRPLPEQFLRPAGAP